MPVGRPLTTLDDLPKTWKKDLITLASEGASDVELQVKINVSNDLWYRLIEEEPEFSATIKKCGQLCEMWWKEHGRKQLENKDFSPVLWYMNMKNRFGWRDKFETKVEHSGSIAGVLAELSKDQSDQAVDDDSTEPKPSR